MSRPRAALGCTVLALLMLLSATRLQGTNSVIALGTAALFGAGALVHLHRLSQLHGYDMM